MTNDDFKKIDDLYSNLFSPTHNKRVCIIKLSDQISLWIVIDDQQWITTVNNDYKNQIHHNVINIVIRKVQSNVLETPNFSELNDDEQNLVRQAKDEIQNRYQIPVCYGNDKLVTRIGLV